MTAPRLLVSRGPTGALVVDPGLLDAIGVPDAPLPFVREAPAAPLPPQRAR